MTQAVSIMPPTPEPAQRVQTITADQLDAAVAAVKAGAVDARAIPVQDALAAFAGALGIQTPQEVEDTINAVGTDSDDLHEFIRAWMSAQHDLNADKQPVTLRTVEELTATFRQWQAFATKTTFASESDRLTQMDRFIKANP